MPRYFPAHISQSDAKRRNLGDEIAKVAAVFSGAWDLGNWSQISSVHNRDAERLMG